MRHIILSVLILLFGFADLHAESASAVFKKIKLRQYYRQDIAAGYTNSGYFPNSVSAVAALNGRYNKYRVLIMYNMRSKGGSFSAADMNRFSEKSLDHIFLLKSTIPIHNILTVTAAGDYMYEFYQTVSSEKWGTGLFDFYRYGASLSAFKTVFKMRNELAVKFHQIKFPNYKNLLSEYMDTGGVDVEEKQDRNITDLVYSVRSAFVVNAMVRAAYSLNSFPALFVLKNDGTKDPSKTQMEDALSFKITANKRLYFVRPFVSLAYKAKNSNQNYFYQKSSSDTNPLFFSDYYSYTTLNIQYGFNLDLFKWLSLRFSASTNEKNYKSRAPRDASGEFITSEKMYIKSNTTHFAVDFKKGRSYTFSPEVVLREQISNDKNEKLFKYNYKMTYFGVKYRLYY